MIATNHWSATTADRLRDYHIEYGAKRTFDEFITALTLELDFTKIDFEKLESYFNIWKNIDLHTPTPFGTYMLNHDPRDGTADIEIGALCMGGERVTTTGSWGLYPFTVAHVWMCVAINARVAILANIDTAATFAPIAPQQNGPIHTISTHAERAWQTFSPDATEADLGYFLFSGDSDCRWDLAILRVEDNHKLATPQSALQAACESANWIRTQVHAFKSELERNGNIDYWGLDRAAT